jgi:hypothetical protein
MSLSCKINEIKSSDVWACYMTFTCIKGSRIIALHSGHRFCLRRPPLAGAGVNLCNGYIASSWGHALIALMRGGSPPMARTSLGPRSNQCRKLLMPLQFTKKENFHQVHILDFSVMCITCHSNKNAGVSTKRLCGIFFTPPPLYTHNAKYTHNLQAHFLWKK